MGFSYDHWDQVNASACGSVTTLDASEQDDDDINERIERKIESTPIYHCWSCGNTRLSTTSHCSGTNHQLRGSRCDLVRIEDGLTMEGPLKDLKVQMRYHDRHTGTEATGTEDCTALIKEKLRRILRLRHEQTVLKAKLDALKEQYEFATKELEAETWITDEELFRSRSAHRKQGRERVSG